MEKVENFIQLLQRGPGEPGQVFNPWGDHDERDGKPARAMPGKRRENMAAYLEARRRSAKVLLLGEAPSHRGARFSGIAFCSETELLGKRDLVARHPLEMTSRDAKVKPQRERSAAVIWGEIERAGVPFEVVLWNAFPWHPHGVDSVSSNRRPGIREVEDGREPLRALLDCFSYKLSIFAVGKVAEIALARWSELECAGYIRHPAQGGEAKFRDGFRNLVATRL